MSRGFYVNTSMPELKNVLKKISTYSESTQQKLRGVVKSSTQAILAGTIRRIPKRTGKMAAGTTMTFDNEKCVGTVRVKGSIAHLVEFGHGGPHPAKEHPFMRPAFEENKPGLIKGIEDAVKS
jgi:HK97 gp10 family phage protein